MPIRGGVANTTTLDCVTSSVPIAVAGAVRNLALTTFPSKARLARADTFVTAVAVPGATDDRTIFGRAVVASERSAAVAHTLVTFPVTRTVIKARCKLAGWRFETLLAAAHAGFACSVTIAVILTSFCLACIASPALMACAFAVA